MIMVATSSLNAHNGVQLKAKMYLKGALENNGLMRDDLRTKGLLPSSEPYTALSNFKHYGEGGGEVIASPAVFLVTGDNAIVDWVVVELRNPGQMNSAVSTHAALLQRDGDVVGMDGASPVHFLSVAPGKYHVVVRHRNHLGVMTAEAIKLTSEPAKVNFSNSSLALFGTKPCAVVGSKRALWMGDANRDNKVIFQGPNNDMDNLVMTVSKAPNNTEASVNFMLQAYSQSDFNLDGNLAFSGPNNDRSCVLAQMPAYCTEGICIIEEQIP